MATTSTGNGARTAQAWKAAATSAQASIKKADAAAYIAQGDLETATTFRDSYYKIANEKNADGTYKYTAAQRAQATRDLATAEQEVVQAKAALSTAAAQRANAENAYNQATGKSSKNTDPQAASTSLPATTTPGQTATAYTTTPPDANAAIADNTVVSSEPTATPTSGAFIPINSQKPGETQLSITAANNTIQPKKQAEETDDQARLRIDRENEAREDARIVAAAENNNTNRGTSAAERNTQTQATQQDISNFNSKEDWRVRLSLASGAKDYLYKSSEPGILSPLAATNGVIFPYTPAVSVAYAAQYDPTTLTHTNYKFYTYNSSSVDQITLSCDFTAQDVFEANYLLAVIHFFRSVTKMFYGQDPGPVPGTPPPLCYLTGLGAFQFDNHPLAITNFTYSLPTEVDYIRAGSTQEQPKSGATSSRSNSRIQNAGLQPGATVAPPQFSGAYRVQEPTYVPTKIQISITAVPIVTRNDVSNNFSLRDYSTGRLLRGSQLPSDGGFW